MGDHYSPPLYQLSYHGLTGLWTSENCAVIDSVGNGALPIHLDITSQLAKASTVHFCAYPCSLQAAFPLFAQIDLASESCHRLWQQVPWCNG